MVKQMDKTNLVWKELKVYNGAGSKSFQLSGCRVKIYKGAMEIPLVSFQPTKEFVLSTDRMKRFSEILSSIGLELDCVEEERNYKINRIEDHQYVGRVTTEALKLHVERSKELGWEFFYKVSTYFIGENENG